MHVKLALFKSRETELSRLFFLYLMKMIINYDIIVCHEISGTHCIITFILCFFSVPCLSITVQAVEKAQLSTH